MFVCMYILCMYMYVYVCMLILLTNLIFYHENK